MKRRCDGFSIFRLVKGVDTYLDKTLTDKDGNTVLYETYDDLLVDIRRILAAMEEERNNLRSGSFGSERLATVADMVKYLDANLVPLVGGGKGRALRQNRTLLMDHNYRKVDSLFLPPPNPTPQQPSLAPLPRPPSPSLSPSYRLPHANQSCMAPNTPLSFTLPFPPISRPSHKCLKQGNGPLQAQQAAH